MKSQLLQGKTAWVTGAGRGLGAGIGRGLARAGAAVCICDVNAAELAATEAEIRAEGGVVISHLVDVSNFSQMQECADTIVATWGRLDVVVNNAAIMPLRSFAEHTPEFWTRMIDVNLNGVYNGVRAAWPHMLRQGSGHCMAIASGSSVRGFVDEVAYCACKHGIEGFSKALAMEAEPLNIAINTLGPGKPIKPTEMTREAWLELPAEQQAQYADPVYLATAFVWLASQPPQRFTGLRFDAGPLADTITAEGYDFDFAPNKVTLYVEDFVQRLERRKEWTKLRAD